ncbi:hypothetical protein [Nocardia jiangxiensis]|uniref:hypothetical protein n=1 Tax=Nocardia jiangxiensis TaxID=282685 RepID=UPI0003164A81|nr:hypothetical protein [Nocardia jiangxiensis]
MANGSEVDAAGLASLSSLGQQQLGVDVATAQPAQYVQEPAATTTSATSQSTDCATTGKTGHYWPVPPLTVPTGASKALRAFISMAHEAIQTAVDLLGRNMPELPPSVDDLLQPVVYTDLGEGESTEAYKQALNKVQTAQTSLLAYDQQVATTTLKVADGHSETLTAIEDIVEKLNTALAAVPAALLKGHESTVMKYIASAVDAVYKKVDEVYSYNQSLAGNSSGSGSGDGSSSSSSSSGSGSGSSSGSSSGSGSSTSGSDGLGSLLSQLAPLAMMIPVGLMALAPTLTQMLQPDQNKNHNGQNGSQPNPGQPNQAAPNNPNAPAANAAPQNNPAATPQNNPSAAPQNIPAATPQNNAGTAPQSDPAAPQGNSAPTPPNNSAPTPLNGSTPTTPGNTTAPNVTTAAPNPVAPPNQA